MATLLWKSLIIIVSLVVSVTALPKYATAPVGKVIAKVDNILVKIAFCESSNKQFDKFGEVLRGKVNPLDVGRYQINLKYHQEESEKMGYDLLTDEGNEAYAIYLFSKEGTKPWRWSEECWK